MAWGPSAWLIVARFVQFLCSLAGTGLNGFVAGSIYAQDHDIPVTMLTLQMLICPILIYTVLAITLQHTGKRIEKRGWLLTFIITDVLFLCVNLAIVCTLARAGLPQSCRGLLTFRPGTDQPQEGFTTLGFSEGSKGQRGELDHFCNHERANFIVSLCLVFTFQATAVFASLTYYQNKHGYDSKLHDGSGDDSHSLQTLRSTPSSPTPNPTPSNHRISFANTVAPASEGILTRNTSTRSTVTTSTITSAGTNPRASLLTARRGQGHAIPRRPIGHSPPPPLPTRSPGGSGGHTFLPLSLSEVDSDDDDDRGVPVADGMRYRPTDPGPSDQHHRPPPPPPVDSGTSPQGQPRAPPPLPPSCSPFSFLSPPPGPSASTLSRVSSGASSTPSVKANRARTVDGMRPSGLPPYEPPPSAPATGFQNVPLDDDDDTPEAAAAATPSAQQPPQPPPRRSHSRDKGSISNSVAGGRSMPLLLEVEEVEGDDAHHALVSDGMRPAAPGLPPYRPPSPRDEREDVMGR